MPCAAILLFLSSPAALGATEKVAPSVAQFDHAEQENAALEAKPEAERTRGDYERVLRAYRAVYHGDPISSKAAASVDATAALLAQEGRVLKREKPLRDAVVDYEFLRHQYPESRYRASALLEEAGIYAHDLSDPAHGEALYEEFLKKYPGNSLAAQAESELAGLRIQQEPGREPLRSPATTSPATTKESDAASSSASLAQRAPSETDADAMAKELPPPVELPVSGPSLGTANRAGQTTTVTDIRSFQGARSTRIVVDLTDRADFQSAHVQNPDRIYFDLRGTRLTRALWGESKTLSGDDFVYRIRAAQYSADVSRVVLDVSDRADYTASFLPNPWRLIIDVHARTPPGSSSSAKDLSAALVAPRAAPRAPSQNPSQAAPRSSRSGSSLPRSSLPHTGNELDALLAAAADGSSDANLPAATSRSGEAPTGRGAEAGPGGEPSLSRTLGLKIGRIVIDAGHGGHDAGTLGPGGIKEKDVTLDVALRLGKLLKQRLGAQVIYTRDDDVFVPLRSRTAIANKAHADLFISIHANSSTDPNARGVESYYLNFTSSADALEVAARENAGSGESIHDLSDLVKEITLQDKIEESRQFASDVQHSLYNGLRYGNSGFKDRGVKKAPFVVLIGANMPSILAEVSYLTNPTDAEELDQAAYRQRIAEFLYRGIARYINGLSGIRLAEASRGPGN